MPATLMMLYGSRDEHDLKTLWRLIQEAHQIGRDDPRDTLAPTPAKAIAEARG